MSILIETLLLVLGVGALIAAIYVIAAFARDTEGDWW